MGDDGGEGCFSGARWSVEDEGGEAVRLDGAAQELALGEDVLLARDLLKGARAHAGGEGLAIMAGHHFRRLIIRREE